MKFCIVPRHLRAVAVVWMSVAFASVHLDAKPIRLRNQVISTSPANASSPAARTVATPQIASGLFLIQFREPLNVQSRAQLLAAGVDLLHYVPDDAFIARFRNVRMSQLRALPFVEWVGQYRSEHKVHPALRTKAAAAPEAELGVTVLIAPRATPAEIVAVRNALLSVRQQSNLRSGTVLRGAVTPGQLNALALSDSVLWLEPAPHFKLIDEVASKIVAGDGGLKTLLTQSLGYDGSGVSVAVADTGLNNGDAATMHPDLRGRTPAFFYYGTLPDAADEHSHGTHVAGIVAGNGATGETDDNGALYGLGVAPGANIIAQRIFDAAGNLEAPTNGFPQLTTDATGAGAVIGSDSWGDDVQGAYDVSAMEFDELVRDATGAGTNNRPYIIEFSAGNAGPGSETIDSPASAKNVIATGASENDREDLFIYADGPDAMADFSSRGPCADGRIKPDIVAPGTWISSLQSESATDQYAWLPIDSLYQYQGGTSQAGPHASGAAAVFVQYYRQSHTNATPSPALVKAALINSATELDPSAGNAPVPNMDEGWGRIDLTSIVDSNLTLEFIDQTTLLTNGQVFEYRTLVAGTSDPLKVTLAYTDVPGFPGALAALVNDLDLEVLAPDGQIYRGNQFDNGESIPNPSTTDTINNVEGVFLGTPVPGEYVIRVRARNVVQDILGASGPPRQDFALVISGIAPIPGVGSLFLDRSRYTTPSQIKITLIDTDQAGHASETVRAVSTTEPNDEAVVLTAVGSSGVFTGAIATATGPAVADGRLEITNNDSIQIIYLDASANTNRYANAMGDLLPPVLTTPTAANSFGQEIISWISDEPSTSIVRYGTNPALSTLTFAITNTDLVTSHSIALDGLVVGKTYYFYVVSADEAGNVATNSSNSAFFTFVPPTTATILLVDEYGTDPLSGTTPTLSGYTDALGAIGVTYDVWDVSTLGPATNVLKSYRAIIWRLPEIQGAWSSAEQVAISNYLHSGGSLFVASMQVLSRLEIDANATNFIHNVLQVDSFVPDPDSTGATEIIGSSNESVGNGIDITMDYSFYSDIWAIAIPLFLPDPPDISETITPSTNATPVLRNNVGDIVGLRWPAIGKRAPGRLVLFTFPLDAAPIGNGVNDRINLLRNAIAFLAPGAAGLATVSLDSPAYSLPSLVTIDVADTNIAGKGTLVVTASSTTQTNGISVTLSELQNSGEFIGSFAVVAATPPPPAGQLAARDGDTLRVDYFNVLANKFVSASAAIDTVPPILSNISAVPGYVDAVVSWNTSEPSDALVQFGESPLFDRTAYSANLTTSHSVTLSGLSADRTYYYQMTSRDAAGNTTIDNNHDKFYTFHTLVPISPPWSDSMDTGATNWSVYSDPNSECAWTLGVPNNGQESSAHSPPDAWGSNLGGAVISLGSTFLISPAILLPAGANATLDFWHSYDFTESSDMDFYEFGQVLLITNSASTSPITLSGYTNDVTSGWQQERLDLTPYAGQLVYLAWDYELFSVDTRAHPGWLVDDVSISASNAPAPLELTVAHPANSVVSLVWPPNPSLKYLVLTSTNLINWVPYSTNWLSTNQFNVPLSSIGQHTFFRLEASPGP